MVVDHSDRNIDTTFRANFFKSAFLLVPGEQRGGGLSLRILKKSLKSPGIKPAQQGSHQVSRLSPKIAIVFIVKTTGMFS